MKKTAFHSYFGGKNQMGTTFISPYIPNDIKVYVEPFSGSMGIYFQSDFKDDVKIIFNDYNKDQANLFFCSKNYVEFLKKIQYHIDNKDGILYCPADKNKKDFYKELYYNTKKSDFSTRDFKLGDYDRAVMYAFLLTSAFNSCHYMAAGFSGFNKDRMKLLTFINKLNNEYIKYKLDKINVVECMDFEELIKKYDSPNTYFYLDPPYAQDDGIKEKGNKRLEWYGVEDENTFGPSSHKRLADLLKTVKGKWSMSYYEFPELSQWFPKDKYKWVSKDFFRSSASFSDNKEQKGTELLIMNYNMSDEEYQINYNKYNTEAKTKTKTMAKKTKPSEELLDKVVDQIRQDFETGDLESVYELLTFVPVKNLEGYLPEVEQKLVENIKQEITVTKEEIIVKTEVKPVKPVEKIELGPDDFGGEDFSSEVKTDDFWG